MDSEKIVSRFSIGKLSFKNRHITGNTKFSNPCIGYVLKGNGLFLYKGNAYKASAGDLVYIASGTRYYSVWTGNPEVEFYSLNFSFSRLQSMSEYKFQLLKNYPPSLFHDMYNTYEKDDFLCMSAFYKVLDDMYKKLIPTTKNSAMKNIEPALEYIEKHSNEEISIQQLADICCCSESTLFKSFQNITGVSPIKYKHNIMIQTALRLLSDTDMSIEEISRETGFSSSNYFRKIFTGITGTTPKTLRKNHSS